MVSSVMSATLGVRQCIQVLAKVLSGSQDTEGLDVHFRLQAMYLSGGRGVYATPGISKVLRWHGSHPRGQTNLSNGSHDTQVP